MTALAKAQDAPVLFVSTAGPTLRIDFAVEAVVSLRHETTAAHRVVRTVTDEGTAETIPTRDARLSDDDHFRIDLETFVFANDYIAGHGVRTALIIPASFNTLAGRKGRRALTDTLGERLKSSAMIEFLDVSRGTPLSRLSEVAGAASALSRGVLVRLSPGRDMAAAVRGYRPHGLTVEAADLGQGDTQIAAQMLSFGDQAKGAAPTLMVFGLPNTGFFSVAMVGGITHASERAAA